MSTAGGSYFEVTVESRQHPIHNNEYHFDLKKKKFPGYALRASFGARSRILRVSTTYRSTHKTRPIRVLIDETIKTNNVPRVFAFMIDRRRLVLRFLQRRLKTTPTYAVRSGRAFPRLGKIAKTFWAIFFAVCP